MAGSRGSTSGQRRERASHEERQRHWIYIGTGVVLALVLVIVAAGLVLTWYLPPRAHVLTVGDRDFTAGDVAARAEYLADAGNGNAQLQPATEGITSLTRQEILLQVGAGMVDEVTEDDVRAAIAERLGLTADAEQQAFADSYATLLGLIPLPRAAFEDIMRAGVIEDRLIEQFKGELPEAGEQMSLRAVTTDDEEAAQALVDAVAGGEDFTEAALDLDIADDEDDVFDLGWFAPEAMNETVSEAVGHLDAGQTSEVVPNVGAGGFVVYYVAERTVDEPYDEAVLEQLATQEFTAFRDAQEEALAIEDDLSDSERDWITRHVQDALSRG